jgi:hypothetical protein
MKTSKREMEVNQVLHSLFVDEVMLGKLNNIQEEYRRFVWDMVFMASSSWDQLGMLYDKLEEEEVLRWDRAI